MPERLRPFRPIKPGEILKEELEARGWTQSDLAAILGRPVQAVHEIIGAKKAITAGTALGLSRAFGTSAEFWLNLESAYRLDLLHRDDKNDDEIARRARAYSLVPVKELMKRGWITQTSDMDTIERQLCRLLEIKTLDEAPNLAVAARKSDAYTEFSPGQIAWFCRARQLARKLSVRPFVRRTFNAKVGKLPQLSAMEDGVRQIPKILGELGIRLVVVEHLPQTYVDGAAFWLDPKSPVVTISLRFDRIDYFWFTLMHELAHIEQNGKHVGHLDDNLVGPAAERSEDKPQHEQDADRRASGWLVPQKQLDAFLTETRPYYSKSAIQAFAGRLGIHPGIVVGRLQFLGEIPFSHSRGMLVRVRGGLTDGM